MREFSWQFSWKSTCEENTRRLVWNGRQPGTQLVVSWQESCTGNCDSMIWVREAGKSPSVEAVDRERLVENVIRLRMRTLVCACQWSLKCGSEWCIQMVNKSNSSNPYPVHSHKLLNMWQYVIINSLLLYITLHYMSERYDSTTVKGYYWPKWV
jgi:hypothetical protein